MHYVNTFEEQNFRYLHVNISIIHGLGKKPGLRPKPGQAKPEPSSMARPKVLESPSPQKPGQSRGLSGQAGPCTSLLLVALLSSNPDSKGKPKLKRVPYQPTQM